MPSQTNIMTIVRSKESSPLACIGGLILDCTQANTIEQAILLRFQLLAAEQNQNLYQDEHILAEKPDVRDSDDEVILQLDKGENGTIIMMAGVEVVEMAWRDWSYILQQIVLAVGSGYIPELKEIVRDIEKAKAKDSQGANKLQI